MSGTIYGSRGAVADGLGGLWSIAATGPLAHFSSGGLQTNYTAASGVFEGVQIFGSGPAYVNTSGSVYGSGSVSALGSFGGRPAGLSTDSYQTALITTLPLASGGAVLAILTTLSGTAQQLPLPAAVINPTCCLVLPS